MNIRKFLNQKIVYWAPLSTDVYGNKTYTTPVEVSVRVVVKNEVRSTAFNDEVMSTTNILAADYMDPLGMVALGTIADLIEDDLLPIANGGVVIRGVLPYVDRRGNTIGYELTTETNILAGRGSYGNWT